MTIHGGKTLSSSNSVPPPLPLPPPCTPVPPTRTLSCPWRRQALAESKGDIQRAAERLLASESVSLLSSTAASSAASASSTAASSSASLGQAAAIRTSSPHKGGKDGKKVPSTGKTVAKVRSRQGPTPGGGQGTIDGLFAKKARKS
jgi:hypothetical protein